MSDIAGVHTIDSEAAILALIAKDFFKKDEKTRLVAGSTMPPKSLPPSSKAESNAASKVKQPQIV